MFARVSTIAVRATTIARGIDVPTRYLITAGRQYSRASVSMFPLIRCFSSGVELDRSEGDINLSPARIEFQDGYIDDETSKVLEDDAEHFMHQALSTPCINAIKSCSGPYIEDLQGNKILDFHGNSVHQVGYGNKDVVEAIKSQLDTLPFCPRRYTNDKAIALAEKLCSLAPGDLNRVLLCPGGTSAIGMALKVARMATQKFKTISMWESFHGASLDCVSIGGEAIFRKNVGPLLPGTEHAPPADEYRCAFKCQTRGGCDMSCADYVEYIMDTEVVG